MVRIAPAHLAQCHYCSDDIDTRRHGTFQFAAGWIENRARGGANALVLPERKHIFACAMCIDRLRHHISPAQMTIHDALPLDAVTPQASLTMARANHNQRTLRGVLADRGYIAAVVERYDSFSGRTHDLFGFLDVLAVGGGETLGVQVTSRSNMASRRRKMREAPELPELFRAGWHVELWGFDQPNGPRTLWRLNVEELTSVDV